MGQAVTTTKPEQAKALTAAEGSAMPDWNSLGAYFEPIFQMYEGWGIDPLKYYATSERFDGLKQAFDKVSETYDIDAVKMCLPSNELLDYYQLSDEAKEQINLSPKLENLPLMMDYLNETPQGKEAINSSVVNNVLICDMGDREGTLGFYNNISNLIGLYNLNSEPLVEWGNGGEIIHTLSEELHHAMQFSNDATYPPAISEDNLYSSRPDEKLWNMFAEAHAKVTSAVTLVNLAQEYPQLLNDFLTDEYISTDQIMVHETLSLYLENGSKGIAEDPSLLWPVYEEFFKSTGDSYHNQFSDYINRIDPADFDRVTMD